MSDSTRFFIAEPMRHLYSWPDRKEGPWVVVIHTSPVNGRMECVGFEIRAYAYDNLLLGGIPLLDAIQDGEDTMDRAEPIRTSTLRAVPLGSLMAQISSAEIEEGPDRIKNFPSTTYWEKRLEAAKAATAGRGGRKGHSPEHYAEVARLYSKVWAQGGHPTKAVKERWDVSKATAAKWVARARDLDFLEPTSKGRSGGVPKKGGDE